MLPSAAFASSDVASFESFYRSSTSISWWIPALVAAAAAGLVISSGGTASPAVVGIGTFVGNAMGLSGAAATKAGLAFIGGGSLASGGFGVAGGTMILTTVLSASLYFSTEVIIDYGVGKAVDEYQYRDLVAKSQELPTLPLPRNTTGPSAYRDAIAVLEEIDHDLPLHAVGNRELIESAITLATLDNQNDLLADTDRIRLATLVSLLKFQIDDYIGAKSYARKALSLANDTDVVASIPAFIYASSGLYEEELDFDYLTNTYLRNAVLGESSNKMIPVLFTIYLDRTMLRMEQDHLGPNAFSLVLDLMDEPAIKEHLVPNLTILVVRHFMFIKLEQQRIAALATTTNDTLRNNPKTLETVERSLEYYSQTLADLEPLLDTLERNIPRRIIPRFNRDATTQLEEFVQLRENYLEDRARLADLVSDLAAYQAEKERLEEEKRLAAELRQQQVRKKLGYLMIGIILIVALSLYMRLVRRRKADSRSLDEAN